MTYTNLITFMEVFLTFDDEDEDILELSKKFFAIVEEHMNSINGSNILFFDLQLFDDFKTLVNDVFNLDESKLTEKERNIKYLLILCLKKIDPIFLKNGIIRESAFK